jgi:hypothetical protein
MKTCCNFLFVILLFTALLSGCNSVSTHDRVAENSPSPSPTEMTSGSGKIDFNGVSFEYDVAVFGDVKYKVIPEYKLEEPDNKPDFVAPRHTSFTFELGNDGWEAKLEVYPIEGFASMYAVNPEWEKGMEREIEDLMQVVIDKDHRGFEDQIPHLPYVDSGQSFQSKVKHHSFRNGTGVMFVTYWHTELALINNDHLQYVFEGLTSDGKYYVVAQTPISVNFLPKDAVSADEFEGYKRRYLLEDYPNPDEIRPRYRSYVGSITNRLERMAGREFKPDLKYFEQMVSSLRVEEPFLVR